VLVEEVLSKDSGGDGVREDGRPLAMYLRDGMLVFLLGGVHSREQMRCLAWSDFGNRYARRDDTIRKIRLIENS
jgi:hypothetical protein